MSETMLSLIMYFSSTVVSFSLFLLIASFRGKNVTDWFLLFRDFLIALVTARFFVTTLTGYQTPSWLVQVHWTLMTVVSVGLFVSLVRNNVGFKINVIKIFGKK